MRTDITISFTGPAEDCQKLVNYMRVIVRQLDVTLIDQTHATMDELVQLYVQAKFAIQDEHQFAYYKNNTEMALGPHKLKYMTGKKFKDYAQALQRKTQRSAE